MAYKMNDYDFDTKQQMHSILDSGMNKLRQSFDRSSNASQSMASSRQSPSLRKKSQIRQVLDDMKSNASSSIANYNDDTQYGFYNMPSQNTNPKNETSMLSNIDFPAESPMKKEIKSKRMKMQSELDLLQRKIQGLEERFASNVKDSGIKQKEQSSQQCFTFHNTDTKENRSLNEMEKEELEDLKKKTSPLRIKKQKQVEYDNIMNQNSNYSNARNSYNSLMKNHAGNPSYFMNDNMNENMNYSQTQNILKGSQQSRYDMNESHRNESHYIKEPPILDSRMSQDELYMESVQENKTLKKSSRNAKNRAIVSSLLSNSYDNAKRPSKKKATNTHRKEFTNSMNPTKNSFRKDQSNQRAISTRSVKYKPSILKSSRLSESRSERSFSHHDRSMSLSLRNEKSAFKDTLKKIRFEDKYKDAYAKMEDYKGKYIKQRKANIELKKKVEKLEKEVEKKDKYQKKNKEIKKEYNNLIDAFDKSEEIRKGQKELIAALRAEISKLRKKGDKEFSSRPKTLRTKRTKSTTRKKSKKPRKSTRT
ncbi:unnamed protein product [Moneuplotes crassus]|uniref:Uncharacterized protein n=1 Tax=Euplotes crassus TaxID=5936 RepID=A0AAD1X875_EUPCR|nr:unnamed protein product [Moneuplotes crassus]